MIEYVTDSTQQCEVVYYIHTHRMLSLSEQSTQQCEVVCTIYTHIVCSLSVVGMSIDRT